ncbi:hypothetical protein FKM82_025649 [Ascaphus truei]
MMLIRKPSSPSLIAVYKMWTFFNTFSCYCTLTKLWLVLPLTQSLTTFGCVCVYKMQCLKIIRRLQKKNMVVCIKSESP